MMTVLDKIKTFFKRAKPVAKIVEKKPPETIEEKPPEATIEKPTRTPGTDKKAQKAIRKKTPRVRKQKKGG